MGALKDANDWLLDFERRQHAKLCNPGPIITGSGMRFHAVGCSWTKDGGKCSCALKDAKP